MPRNCGCLGIRDTRIENLAMLGKLVWRMLHEHDKLWVQVLTHKHIQTAIWRSNSRGSPSIIWKGILNTIEALREGFKMRINSGNTSFWHTEWTGSGPLRHLVDFVHISYSQFQLKHVWQSGR